VERVAAGRVRSTVSIWRRAGAGGLAGAPVASRSVRLERVHAAAWTTELERQRPPAGLSWLERLSARARWLERFWPSAGAQRAERFRFGAGWLERIWPSAGARGSERFRAGNRWQDWFRAGTTWLAQLRPSAGARRSERIGTASGQLEQLRAEPRRLERGGTRQWRRGRGRLRRWSGDERRGPGPSPLRGLSAANQWSARAGAAGRAEISRRAMAIRRFRC
jgi:hypothetical protein